MKDNILIIEDDVQLLEAISDSLSSKHLEVDTAIDGEAALEKIKSKQYKFVLSDVQLPNIDGLSLIDKIKHYIPDAKIIMMTAYGTIQDAVLAIQKGAHDYISKPFEMSSLLGKLNPEKESKELNVEVITQSDEKMQYVYKMAKKVAQSQVTVLLSGESGTGKEILSRYIHSQSNRSDCPFIAVNCAAIPDNMLEAMLFGYEKGAFTGAIKSSEGKFEQANGGTLLLDEISEMPLALQAKLLRVLQEKEVERLGGKKLIKLDVRVIATTNKDLKSAVESNQFRKDLYFRLNVFPIHIPSLRERKHDIVGLSQYLLKKHYPNNAISISPNAAQFLMEYHWPGNVRELENILQRAAILSSYDEILPQHIQLDDEAPHNEPTNDNLAQTREGAEHQQIYDVLIANDGNRTKTAKALGISPRTLRYKLAKMKGLGFTLPN